MGFSFAGCEFSSLNTLIDFFSTKENFIEANGDQFQLMRPVYRGLCTIF